MTFSTLSFLFIVLPLFIIIYYVIPSEKTKWRTVALIVMSLLFYSFGDVKALPMLVFSVLFNYFSGREIMYFDRQDKQKLKKASMITAVVINLLLLSVFKYTNLKMPIGISFYTFSAISYILDIYMKRCEGDESFLDAACYMTFFPKLVSGPIVQFKDFRDQVGKPVTLDREHMSNLWEGGYLFLIGLFKKVLLADQLGLVFGQIKVLPELSGLSALLGALFYSLQLYFDFSGYSDMAIGIAKVLGFRIDRNFNYPYISENISDFWRRWHISLGAWFRDYIYIPMGGNRCSKAKQLRNLSVVWLITGIWHGSTWNFVIWGMYHGLFVIAEKFLIKDKTAKWPRQLRIIITDIIVFVGWIFFFTPNIQSAFNWIESILCLKGNGFLDNASIYYLYSNLPLIIAGILCSGPWISKLQKKIIEEKKRGLTYLSVGIHVVLIFFCISMMVGSTYSSFLYFDF